MKKTKEEELKEILDLTPKEFEEKKKLVIDSKNQVTVRIPASFAYKADLKKGAEVTIVLNPTKERLTNLVKEEPIIIAFIKKNGKK